MYAAKVSIQNETGLHAKPASELVACAGRYACDIQIRRASEEKTVNAKSVIMLMSLALEMGTEVEIMAEGENETEAVSALVDLINTKFGEN
jgi:phosphocarrier protein